MTDLNFHHLRYFWAVANAGSMARAAERLRVSSPALSVQIQALEASLGHALFERQGKRLVLTEAGTIALDYANAIFAAGAELLGVLVDTGDDLRRSLRVGAVSTLSRNFQRVFLAPLLPRTDVSLLLTSGGLDDLVRDLEAHRLDVVLTNTLPARTTAFQWVSHALAEQPASLVGKPRKEGFAPGLKTLLATERFVLPTTASGLRHSFDALATRLGVRPNVAAEVDDMATLRVIAKEHDGLALVPPIVVQDELRLKKLVEVTRISGLRETFFAITATRRFPNPLIADLFRQEIRVEPRRR
jgi:LysR family transcriptional regulator, transcriptional activator of nhaA